MAQEGGNDDREDEEITKVASNGKLSNPDAEAQDDASEEEEEEEEPRLKYASLTRHLRSVYRNGDSTSAFLVAGDKMLVGTHNGHISIRSFRAHQASITSVSVSPFPPPLAATKVEGHHQKPAHKTKAPTPSAPRNAKDSPQSKNTQQPPVPLIPSNAIFIASSSIDGHVFVTSLTDPKDVQLRNFGRPLHAVALSPEFKSDRSYLSGGRAGSLVLTVGGQTGTKSDATTTGAAASASGWLGSIGLGSNTGKDQVLHSGEGAISCIKWSLSGKYVVWVNEHGIKFMRSNLHLESMESDLAWKRMKHIDHPNRPGWDELAGIWKAHVEWIDEAGLESDELFPTKSPNDGVAEPADIERLRMTQKSRTIEKLVVGWSGTIWIVNVHPAGAKTAKAPAQDRAGLVELITILRMDCIISGISLYTPKLLLILAYVTPEEDTTQKTTKRGLSRRQNASQPEMRIVDVTTKKEVSVADTLHITRYESLSATDYHLSVLPAIRMRTNTANQRGTLEAIGGGIEAIGGGIWDATMYPTKLFSSSASVRSRDSTSPSKTGSEANAITDLKAAQIKYPKAFQTQEPKTTQLEDSPDPSILTHGMKIFIQSPYDCIIATKPTLPDHFIWLDSHARYEEAWNLLDRSPEAAATAPEDRLSDRSPSTPTDNSLSDFFADDQSLVAPSEKQTIQLRAKKEKIRVGERWVDQLVTTQDWEIAGKICGQVLGTPSAWERWIRVFAQADKFDDITPFVPYDHDQGPLSRPVYELILGHYVSQDIPQFCDLLRRWPPELFDVDSIIETIHGKFKSGEISEDSVEDNEAGRDWRLLMESLARLYLAVGRPRKALRCYIRLQDADAAMSLISETHLVEAVADDIPGFILLRVSKDQQRTASLSDLAELTLEPIRLLVTEAHRGVVLPESVIHQLNSRYSTPNPYLFFYFRALWHGDTSTDQTTSRSTPKEERLLVQEGKNLVSDYADTAVALFAEYDRDLLMTFLKASQSYTLSSASKICEQRNYTPELVYLLSKEGRTAQALRLIIDSIGDVSQAIQFAKEQHDPALWDDLIEESMDKPSFITGLLKEVGTSIDPLNLIQRIPSGLEVQGLKDGLQHILREFEVQESISRGAARVLRGEINRAMQSRSSGLRKGIRFSVAAHSKGKKQATNAGPKEIKAKDIKPGHCAGCGDAINDRDSHQAYLIAFPCEPHPHTFHLSCLLRHAFPPGTEPPSILREFLEPSDPDDDDDWAEHAWDRSVGPKVDRARLIGTVLGKGCPLEGEAGEGEES
ncbi:uncharacterized protein KY384_005743 [Bacidia gigantensis]|uniref:uncharacterized protein n=1 Tax=Bacidia gigantensis TaxID=2732470 RepID=UPI001D05BB94|nr:uncharacterized protein KY384_005743 [Bacidia gigantensis]KAG8529108.1 hypothetical protein KY384_005743 [Bacidia gigantensis]